jgi:hypothetical protein
MRLYAASPGFQGGSELVTIDAIDFSRDAKNRRNFPVVGNLGPFVFYKSILCLWTENLPHEFVSK